MASAGQGARSRQWLTAGVLLGALVLLGLRIRAAVMLSMNSDEPQHLHVVWAWTQGLVPYRDVFDNHAPLFQWLCAPLLAYFGERADIVALMRLAMIPLYFGTLAATWWIGRALWSPRVGLYAAALVGALPPFFVVSGQFRPDDLWMLLWLVAIAIAVTRPLSATRAFVAGVVLGAAFAVSLKTLLLVATAVVAAATLWGLRWIAGDRTAPRNLRLLLPALAGIVLVPGAFALYFACAGAMRAAVYCLFTHNALPGLGHWGDLSLGLLFPAVYPLTAWAAWRTRARGDPVRWWRRSWVLLSTSAFVLALYSYWPLLSPQDLLPVLPLLALALSAWLFADHAPTSARGFAVVAAILLASAGGALLVRVLSAEGALRGAEAQLARVLALTRPDDPVMDAKGESIFRRRPVYWVLETITQQRMQEGLIVDDIAARLAATATPVVIAERLPLADAAFVTANYLPIGLRVYVAGQHLGPLRAGEAVHFTIAVPATYSVITAQGAAPGSLDGEPGTRARPLAAGTHTFVAAIDGAVALVWSPALTRGVAPGSLFAETKRP